MRLVVAAVAASVALVVPFASSASAEPICEPDTPCELCLELYPKPRLFNC